MFKCLSRPANAQFLALRPEFVALCDNDVCEGMILSAYEFRTNLAGSGAAVVLTSAELRQMMCGAYSEKVIRSRRLRLRDRGVISFAGQVGREHKDAFRVNLQLVQDWMQRYFSNLGVERSECKLAKKGVLQSAASQPRKEIIPVEAHPTDSTTSVRTDVRLVKAPVDAAVYKEAEEAPKETASLRRDRVRHITEELEAIAKAYPRSEYAHELNNPRSIAEKIERKLRGRDELGFFDWVKLKKFVKEGLTPAHCNGPRSAGLLLTWAEEYALRFID